MHIAVEKALEQEQAHELTLKRMEAERAEKQKITHAVLAAEVCVFWALLSTFDPNIVPGVPSWKIIEYFFSSSTPFSSFCR
jgi:hypothetical protein